MEDLIKALNIFLKYGNSEYPTNCEHDILYVNIDPEIVAPEDILELARLGFFDNEDGFMSFKYGSN